LISNKQVIALPDTVKFSLTSPSAAADLPVNWYMLLCGYDSYGTKTVTTQVAVSTPAVNSKGQPVNAKGSPLGYNYGQASKGYNGVQATTISYQTVTSVVQDTTLGTVTYLATPEFRPATGNTIPTELLNTKVALNATTGAANNITATLPAASRQGIFTFADGVASVDITFQPDSYINHELYIMRAVFANGFFVDSPVITTTDGATIGTWSASADKNVVPANTSVTVKVSTASLFSGNRFNYQIQGLTANDVCGASLNGAFDAFSVNSTVGVATLSFTANANIANTKSANIVITSTIPDKMTPATGVINLQVTPGTVTMPQYTTYMDYVSNTSGLYIVVNINTVRVPDGQQLTWDVQRRRNGSLLSTSALFTATIANNSYVAPFLIDYVPNGETMAGDTRVLTVYSGNTVLANSSTVIPANTNSAAFNSGVKIGY